MLYMAIVSVSSFAHSSEGRITFTGQVFSTMCLPNSVDSGCLANSSRPGYVRPSAVRTMSLNHAEGNEPELLSYFADWMGALGVRRSDLYVTSVEFN